MGAVSVTPSTVCFVSDELSDCPDTALGIALLSRYEFQATREFLASDGAALGLTPRAAYCSLEDALELVCPPGYSVFEDDGIVGSEEWMRLKKMSASNIRNSPIILTLLGNT
jgi:hypothetical protein